MIVDSFEKLGKRFSQKKHWRTILFWAVSVISLITIGLPVSLRPSPFTLKVGEVTFQDIRAPRSFSYTSEILTKQARDAAEKSVSPTFLPADPQEARKQFENLNQVFGEIEGIRLSSSLTLDEKVRQIQTNPKINLTQETAKYCFSISDTKWGQLKNESYLVFEQIIRNPINSDQLDSVKKNIPNYIGYSFSEKDVELISQIISPFIRVNSVYSNEKTNEAVQAAREKVIPIIRSYTSGEMIVFSGQVVTPLIWETLQSLGLVQLKNEPLDLISAGLLILVSLLIPILYFRQVKKPIGEDPSSLILISILFVFFILTAKLVISNHTVLPYLFPVIAFGLVISSLFDYEMGIIGLLPLGILVSYILSNNLELIIYYLLTGTLAIFILGKGRRLITFFTTGLAIGAIGSAVIFVFHLASGFFDFEEMITMTGIAFLNGLGSISLALLLQNYSAALLGRTTALQLMDLSRPDHPLLQYLLLKAPGTYQHSIQTANLAEQAARMVKADPLLARVGALYHDIGKTKNPSFFIENQERGDFDVHENLDPKESARTIIRHVNDGVLLAKKHNLPPQIVKFITEHHGNTIARFQYQQMKKSQLDINQAIDRKQFTYPGHSPRTRETAILMLADGCEARVRAENPKNEIELQKIVEECINYYIQEHQLDNVNLTLRDIKQVEDSFVVSLSTQAHKRIKYPSLHPKK
jgi:cyclic-di-AMP phosphodiesterase PgpH